MFIVCYYFRACSSNAPRNDIDLQKANAKETNKAIREAGLKVLGRHMWFLLEVTVRFTPIDDELSLEEKRNAIASFVTQDTD